MFRALISFVFLLAINSLCICQDSILEDTELILAFMIHRHGDRTPVELTVTMATDPTAVKNLSSKYGYGQLTDVGKLRSYELGKTIRRRYDSYLSPQYNRSEIYIRSTDSTRAKMTVLTAMAAVYHTDEDNWSNDIKWTPVPYTTVPPKYDFNLAIVNCPNFITEYTAAFVLPYTDLSTKYSDLLNNMAEVTGINITKTPVLAYALYDVYVSEASLGISLGDELEAMMPELGQIAADSMDILFGDDSNIALQAGVLLNEFFTVADSIISGEDAAKIQVYSAHDVNVYAFQAITRIQPRQGVPKYNSMYSLEVRKVLATGEYIVVPVYFQEPGVDEVYLLMDGCDGFCTLDAFRSMTSEFVLDADTWRMLCDFSEDYDFNTSSVN